MLASGRLLRNLPRLHRVARDEGDHVVPTPGGRAIRVDARRETLTRPYDRPEHHGEVATAHLSLGQARELGQPSPERFVVPLIQETRELVVERLVVRERTARRITNQLVRDAAARYETDPLV